MYNRMLTISCNEERASDGIPIMYGVGEEATSIKADGRIGT